LRINALSSISTARLEIIPIRICRQIPTPLEGYFTPKFSFRAGIGSQLPCANDAQAEGIIMSRRQGAMLPDPLVDDHAEAINSCWRRSGETINEVSIACYQANVELDLKAKKQLMKKLLFSAAQFCKFAKIGGDSRLTDPKRQASLPLKMSARYELHQFSDEEFQAFETEGRLTQRLRRADIIGWLRARRGETPKQKARPRLSSSFLVALKPRRQLASTEESSIYEALKALAEKHEMEVVHPEVKPRGGGRDKALAQIRRDVRKLVATEIKSRRTKLGSHAFQSKPELQKHAGFYSDEITIEPNADVDRIREVLSMLDLDDKFESIRDAAYEKYPNDGPEAPQWMEDVADKPPPREALEADMEVVREQLRGMKDNNTPEKGRFAGFT
jgi:hypothetical protein